MTYLLAVAAGALYCIGFAPFDWWPLTFAAIAVLFVLAQRDGLRLGWLVWCFGIGKYGVGVSWVYVSIHVYGNAAPPLAGFLVVLFVAALAALFCLPMGWLYARLRDRKLPWGWLNVLVFAGVWVLFDWLSTWFLTGFPWLLPGYAFMQTPLANIAPIIGVLGLGMMVVLSAAACGAWVSARAWRGHQRWSPPVAVIAVGGWALGMALYWVDWVTPVGSHSVALVQGNIDQNLKWLPDQAEPNIRRHVDLSAPHWDADLMVWPEAAVTLFPRQASTLLEQLGERAHGSSTNVVLGIPGVEELADGRYAVTNMALALGLGRGRYAKVHLVPFGEYVPLEGLLRGLIGFFDLPMSSSSPGRAGQPNLQLSMGEAAMAICYEVAYPETMRRAARSASVLMTLSNDTWFGSSIGPLQHMQIAQMRALENGRWLLRDTNNGVTAIVDHRGAIVDRLPQFEMGVLRGEFSVMSGRTPYSYVGHWPVLLLLVLLLGWRARLLWSRPVKPE